MPPASSQSPSGSVLIGGRSTPYTVRRSAKARYARIQIHPRDGLQVVLPHTTPDSEAARLLQEKRDWLAGHATQIHRAARSRLELRDGVLLPFRGDWLSLTLGHATRTAVRVAADGIHVRLAPRNRAPAPDRSAPSTDAAIRAALERWYRREARRVILDRLRSLRRPDDPPVRRVAIRDQDTRWGSCSSAGTLSFNWRLVMAPPPVADAVVVHELVHLTIANHSPAFWDALDRRFPRHAACRRWLDANAYRLGF